MEDAPPGESPHSEDGHDTKRRRGAGTGEKAEEYRQMREMLRAGSDQAASALGRHVAAGRDLVEAADPQRRIASMRANDVVDRYFSRTYLVDAAGPGQDQFVHWHSNKLSVVGMSPAHPLVARCRARLAAPDSGASNAADAPSGDLPAALQAALAGRETVALPDDSCQASVAEGRFIKRVEYKVGTKRPTGKRKKGAEFLAPDSVLCVVTDTEGQEHSVVAGMRCSVLEINFRLLANPDLIVTHPETIGFVAITRVKVKNYMTERAATVSAPDYVKLRGKAAVL